MLVLVLVDKSYLKAKEDGKVYLDEIDAPKNKKSNPYMVKEGVDPKVLLMEMSDLRAMKV